MAGCTQPARGTKDGGATSPLPFNDVINDDPCGKPVLASVDGVLVTDNLCLFHYQLREGAIRRPHPVYHFDTVPDSEGTLEVDVYATDFPCVRWDAAVQAANPDLDLTDGAPHAVTLTMRDGFTTQDLIDAASPVMWFDNNGQIGKFFRPANVDLTVENFIPLLGHPIIVTYVSPNLDAL
jgi:hypothetical protein